MLAKTKEEYESLHGELMNEWMKKHGADFGLCGFAKDGVVSPEVWFSLAEKEERIMFLLKEAYTVENPNLVWDEAKWLSHQECMDGCEKDCSKCAVTGSTFNPIADWVYGICAATDGNDIKYDDWLGVTSKKMQDYYAVRDELLSRIAIVNIKKSSGHRQNACQGSRMKESRKISVINSVYWLLSSREDSHVRCHFPVYIEILCRAE